jgi:hypothetical protein
MASVNATNDKNSLNGITLVTWALTDSDTGTAFPLPYAADLTVQVSGTFGSATAVLEGSNDGTNWSTLNAWIGTNTSFTAAGIRKAVENPGYIRAKTSGGTSATISVVVAVKAMFDKKAY